MEHEPEIGSSGTDRTSRVQGEPADAFAIGELINERYTVLARISEGPSGKLYRAQDGKTESEVTLKLLLGWPGLDDALIGQLGEALSATRALAGKRPNIALVLDCDLTPDGRAFVVMERLEGRNLAELIRWREPLSVERALQLAFRIAEGLRAAHEIGLVHGALGAEHVFVQPDDTVKIVGFEIARLRAGHRASSLPSPEPAEVLTEASDTQAVAMVLLEMLTSGVRPGPQGVTSSHPEAPRGGEVPVAVKQLVMQALVKPPGSASHDMGTLARALSAELRRRPEPSSSRAWRRARPRPRRRQWTLMGAGVLAITVSALIGWVAWSYVAASRSAVTREVPAPPPRQVIPGPSVPDATPLAPPSENAVGSPLTLPPVTRAEPPAPERPTAANAPPASDAVPRARVRLSQPESPARDTPPPAAAERAPVGPPREVVRPAPATGSARSESDAPDPSAIIDWLIRARGGSPEQP